MQYRDLVGAYRRSSSGGTSNSSSKTSSKFSAFAAVYCVAGPSAPSAKSEAAAGAAAAARPLSVRAWPRQQGACCGPSHTITQSLSHTVVK
jgi:hypothetical protein